MSEPSRDVSEGPAVRAPTFGTLVGGPFAQVLDRLPAAFAVTTGPGHHLAYVNAVFRRVLPLHPSLLAVGGAIELAFPEHARTALRAALDRTFRTGVVIRNRYLNATGDPARPIVCSIWPGVNRAGETEHLLIELHLATEPEANAEIQRDVTERLLLSALREQDAAAFAEAARRGSAFLASEGRRLAESLDVAVTLEAIERMSLPLVSSWCFVDTLADDGTMHRLAIVHPDPVAQSVIAGLGERWVPHDTDRFGLPAMMRRAAPLVVVDDVATALAASARDADVRAALPLLKIGALLTVPMVVRDQLIGAITFVSATALAYTAADAELAEDLASRGATALDRARAHGSALALMARAEAANAGKTTFLGMMSHELRTPLNAIGGYVDIIDMGLRGPVTEEQHSDLARIRRSQRYLIGLITDLLNLTRVDGGQYNFVCREVVASDVVANTVAMLDPLIKQKALVFDGADCDADIVMLGDEDRIVQILVNLVGNAIKFSPPGSELVIDCETREDVVRLRVCDTGIGIPADKLEEIFDPFVQVTGGLTEPQGGVGLGLAISRALARGMHGDIGVESTLGHGARFTLTLPRASRPDAPARRPATLA